MTEWEVEIMLRGLEIRYSKRLDERIAELEGRIAEHVREQLSLIRAEFKRELLNAEWGPHRETT